VYCFNEYLAIDLELNNIWKEKDELNGPQLSEDYRVILKAAFVF